MVITLYPIYNDTLKMTDAILRVDINWQRFETGNFIMLERISEILKLFLPLECLLASGAHVFFNRSMTMLFTVALQRLLRNSIL